MTLSAERHVHILSTNHRLAVLAGRSESEAGVLLAQLADGGQLLDLFTLWDQLENVGEGSS